MAIASLSLEDIVRGIKDSTYELDTESRLATVGLKDEQDLAAILEKYAWLYGPDTVRSAREAYEAESDPSARERARRVYYYVLDGYVGRQTAALEDRVVSHELAATVEVDGERIPYHNVRATTAREPDFDRRDRLRDAALEVVEATNPDRREIVRARLSTLADEFGHGSYTGYNAEKKRVDYSLLRSRLEEFLARTEGAYTELMTDWVGRTTGRRLGELGSHHYAYISRLPEYDRHFEKDRLLPAYERTLEGLGLDMGAQPNIRLDLEDRPKKNPRAVCYAPDPPSEVHLIIKPQGGLDDYSSFFHEAGHAQHYGNVDPGLDYIYRVIGTSYALTEIYSFLLQFLTVNPVWLREVAGLPEDPAREVEYYLKLDEFFFLRRYSAKLAYELEFYEEPLAEGRNRALYAERLSGPTGFLYPEANYLNDMDAGYYSADYLRAWITEAMLRSHLEREHGTDWFRNPGAGRFLRGLWASGEVHENEDVARMIGREPFDTSDLTAQFLSLPQLRPSAR
jgi:hypothetical protein